MNYTFVAEIVQFIVHCTHIPSLTKKGIPGLEVP